MAAATTRQRAQLLREMNRTRPSSRSSRQSQSPQPTISDFDPDNEAMMSTRQFDNAQKLPELRASAQKYKKPQFPEPEYAIDTSALGRAFPDFSKGSSSDDSDISIEIGRGAKNSSRENIAKLRQSHEYSSSADINPDDDTINLKAPMIGDYQVMYTPPLVGRSVHNLTDGNREDISGKSKARRASGLRNEIEPSPPAKTKDYGSGESRKSSEGNHRTLSAMHARLKGENDIAQQSEERPPTVDLTVRNTRFGNTKPQQPAPEGGLPTGFNPAKGLYSGRPVNEPANNHPATPQGTKQSFDLPGMPNISELVSGVFEDGTPVFSRHGKPRASHTTRGHAQTSHVNIDELPIPFDEQAIFLSLKLLQDKVSLLEREKAEGEIISQDLEKKNRQLEAERIQRRRQAYRSDSALGTTDSEGPDDMTKNRQRGHAIQRNRLESSVRTLQTQLDASNRRASTAEAIIHNVTQERDSSVSQLGVAYVTIEQLKAEKESCEQDNQDLKERINQLTEKYENRTKERTAKATATRQKLVHGSEAIDALQDQKIGVSSVSQEQRVQKPHTQSRAQPSNSNQLETNCVNDYDELFDLTPKPHEARQNGAKQNIGRQMQGKVYREDSINDSAINARKPTTGPSRPTSYPMGDQTADTSKNLTYLSFIDSRDVAKLRKTIEAERLEQKQRVVGHQAEPFKDTAFHQDQLDDARAEKYHNSSCRSSIRSLDGMVEASRQDNQDLRNGMTDGEHNRRHSEGSMISTRSRRRVPSEKNMTSAFILPDITIRNEAKTQNLDESKILVNEERTMGKKRSMTIPKPIPVSERVPETVANDEDPTMRPAQTPGVALATVIKAVEDEVTQLKVQLSSYQKLYDSHNPALSKRKRKFVFEKMQGTMQAIDAKSDQIYNLYDVLEGQKQKGQELTEEQVEVTLQSIGFDVSGIELRGGGGEPKRKSEATSRLPWELSSEDGSDEDLPWEGIESTIQTNKTSSTRPRARSGSRF